MRRISVCSLAGALAVTVLTVVASPPTGLAEPSSGTLVLVSSDGKYRHTYSGTVSHAVVDPLALPVGGVRILLDEVSLIRGERAPEPPPCEGVIVPAQTVTRESWFALRQRPPLTWPFDLAAEANIAPVSGTETSSQEHVCATGSYDSYQRWSFDITIPEATLATMVPGCYQFHGYNPNSGDIASMTGSLPTMSLGAGACDDLGRLEVVAAADNDLGAYATFSYTGAVSGTTTVGTPLASSVTAGSHTVTQVPHAQFALSAIDCDGPYDVNLVAGSVTVDVGVGQTVRCTFHNAALVASIGYHFDVTAVKNPPHVEATGFNFVHIDAPASMTSRLRICAYDSWRLDVKKSSQSDLISILSLPSDIEYYNLAYGSPVPWRSATLGQPTPTSCADGPDLVYNGSMEAASLYVSAQVLAVRHSVRIEILRDGELWSAFEVPGDDFTPKYKKNVAVGDLDCHENLIRLPAERAVVCAPD